MTDQPPPPSEDSASDGSANDASTRRSRLTLQLVGFISVAIVVIGVLLIVLLTRDDTADAPASTSTDVVPATTTASTTDTTLPTTTSPRTTTSTTVTTTTISATTTTPTSTPTSTPPTTIPATSIPVTTVPTAADTAIWPPPGSEIRYDEPVAASVGFAEQFVGITGVIPGEFQQGDARSGEVELRTTESGPVTLVLVRQVGTDDAWSVLGSSTANIGIDEPENLATVTSPLTISGESTAFEGTVQVQLFRDGVDEPLVDSFVTGGSFGELGPFAGTFEWDANASGGAVLMLFTVSSDDGSIIEASALRLFLAG
jgi:Immunoglobulin-like domain of bacterial spore germination